MELDEALTRISVIRQHMAQTTTFRGYRALTTAFSGLVGLLAASLQSLLIPDPLHHIPTYLTLWVGAAVINILAYTIELTIRYRRTQSPLQKEQTLLAADLFAPALLAGAALTWVLVYFAPETIWMLPGLWAVFFGLGIFASRRLLPFPLFFVGGFYLIAGILNLILAHGPYALHPWAMGITFGVGQLLNATVLYWTLERKHGRE